MEDLEDLVSDILVHFDADEDGRLSRTELYLVLCKGVVNEASDDVNKQNTPADSPNKTSLFNCCGIDCF